MKAIAAEIQILRATDADAGAIVSALWQAFAEFQPLYTPYGFAATVAGTSEVTSRIREGPVWVAIRHGDYVGTASAVQKPTGVYVRGMGVVPGARRMGIGWLLLREAESFAIQSRAPRLFLDTTPFLGEAIQLYRRFGFTSTGDQPRDLFGTPLLTMEKILGPSA